MTKRTSLTEKLTKLKDLNPNISIEDLPIWERELGGGDWQLGERIFCHLCWLLSGKLKQ
jgi:hypothetical protein